MAGIVWRTRRRGILVWVIALMAGMVGTAAAVARMYNTPAKIQTYAEAVTSGSALAAINGHVEGIDSLGGVVQDEFGFLASFLLPLLGIGLVVGSTRREEESGRLETTLGGRIARYQPTLAALAVATAAILATAVLFAGGLVLVGVQASGAILYGAALGGLAFVFAGFAALVAQLVLHSRGVYLWSLTVLAAAYVLRGIGDATKTGLTWLTWLSPLGWAEKTAPFGGQRWWVLAMPFAVGVVLGGAAVWLAARRDVGSALLRGRVGPARATWLQRRPVGLALWIHRPAALGWLAGGILLTAMMGSLVKQLLGAMAGNPALAESMGIQGGRPVDGFVAATQLYLAVVAGGYVIQAIGTLRAEEADGRLETRLSGTLSRIRWLAAHTVVVAAGLALIVVVSSLVLAISTAWSVGDAHEFGSIMKSGLDYLPAELVLAGVALALFGSWPRGFGLAWVGYAVATFIAFLGPGLKLARWLLDLAPTTHVGNPPLGAADPGSLSVLTIVAGALLLLGFIAFNRRDIPRA
ncbi:ABC-2 type transport system permease protein [Kribbella aluminosa]|uniref:ABC-2 type transport system permease protein n=2 Tax=Kribbella aluminosa TaxID=416017 RepID=A0ABS4ULU0_9ACTN|nr:ABC-2 type transport system permease protein [Kribbella aluminosa]